jgi:hypothetical protein
MNAFRCASVLCCALGASLTLGWLVGPEDEGDVARVSAELDRATALSRHCLAVKAEVCTELIAGRLSLFEAAVRFRAASAEVPARFRRNLAEVYPGDSDDERECRRVIEWVRSAGDQDAGVRDQVADRLEVELCEHLAEQGTVRLPEIALVEVSVPVQIELR